MPNSIVTINNVSEIEYTALMELLHDVYAKDLPAVDINNPPDNTELERLMVFFSNQYAYITELWARMAHEVRLLKRMGVKNKDAIDLAMDKREYLSMILSALKIKYYSTRTMLKYHSEEMR